RARSYRCDRHLRERDARLRLPRRPQLAQGDASVGRRGRTEPDRAAHDAPHDRSPAAGQALDGEPHGARLNRDVGGALAAPANARGRAYPLASGVGQPRSTLTLFTTSVTTPQSGRLSRRRSASLSTMRMSFSAHGIGSSSGRVFIAQLPALLASSAPRSCSGSTPSPSASLNPSWLAEMQAHRMRLLIILPTWPAPSSPPWKMSLAKLSIAGLDAA